MAKTRKTKKTVKRLFLFGLLCLAVNAFVFYSLSVTWKQIYEKRKEKEVLDGSLVVLKEEEESLKSELNKLKDSSYVARYAREKLFYSDKNEYIIKIK